MEEEVRRGIGARLRESREACKLTQAEVSADLGVIRQTVSGWECGRGMPDTEQWRKIAVLYGASLDYLVCGVRINVLRLPVLADVFRQCAPARPTVPADA